MESVLTTIPKLHVAGGAHAVAGLENPERPEHRLTRAMMSMTRNRDLGGLRDPGSRWRQTGLARAKISQFMPYRTIVLQSVSF
jgi:hypothetical protein